MNLIDVAAYTVAGEELLLLPEKVVFWKRKRSLLLADLHLGKSGHFRKAGIAVSSQVHQDDLSRLTAVIKQRNIEVIYLLGDLFHSIHNKEWKYFAEWRRQHLDVAMHLVKGNHDILEEQWLMEGKIILHQESLVVAPFFLTHQPVADADRRFYQLHGHLHPAVRLRGKGMQSATFPCFCFGKTAGVLPAFGGFTGHSMVRPSVTDGVFIIYNNTVKQVLP